MPSGAMSARKIFSFNSFHFILSYGSFTKCQDIPETVKFDVVTSESGIVEMGSNNRICL
jgi:hypothetical protein